jgi:uncharacterized membrane protein YcaP (DUF421 family)
VDSVVRAIVVYLFLMLLFRVVGKRTLNETSPFDIVLLLIISESVQQAMIDSDNSITNAFLLAGTLVGLNFLLSLLRYRFPSLGRVIDGVPLVLVNRGEALKERLDRERVDEDEIISTGREMHGIARLDQVRYAVLEDSGKITIVPVRRD